MLRHHPTTLADLPQLVLQQDFDEVTRHIARPLSVFVGEQMVTVITRDMARGMLANYRRHLKEAGTVAVFSRLVSVQPMDEGRALQMSHSVYLDGDGNKLGDSLVRATLRPSEEGLGIDLMRFIRAPLDLRLDQIVPLSAVG